MHKFKIALREKVVPADPNNLKNLKESQRLWLNTLNTVDVINSWNKSNIIILIENDIWNKEQYIYEIVTE